MDFQETIKAGRQRIADITRTMDPALVIPAAREAARLVRAYRDFSTRPLVPGVAASFEQGEGDARVLSSAALAVTINTRIEHVDQAMNHMAKLLETVADEHVETVRQIDGVAGMVGRAIDCGRAVRFSGYPEYLIKRIVDTTLAKTRPDADMDVKPLAVLLDGLVQAGFHDEGLRLCRAVDKMGRAPVGRFFKTIQPTSRTWLAREVQRNDMPMAA